MRIVDSLVVLTDPVGYAARKKLMYGLEFSSFVWRFDLLKKGRMLNKHGNFASSANVLVYPC